MSNDVQESDRLKKSLLKDRELVFNQELAAENAASDSAAASGMRRRVRDYLEDLKEQKDRV